MAGVKLFLSGVENSTHFNYCLQAGAFNLLTSYYQFYDKDKDTVKKRKQKHPQLNFLIDSGAHTFITDWMQFTSWKQKDFDEYAENYVRWIYDNRDYLWCAVELDIDLCLNMVLANNQQSTLGTSIVESWQKSLFMPLQKKGIRIIYVWHKERGLEGWEDMCAKFDYVGLPGHLSKENEFNKYMAIARRYCTRVHGFAASVTGDSRVVVKNSEGLIEELSIENLFALCQKVSHPKEWESHGFLPTDYSAWSLTDSLKRSFEPIQSVVRHRTTKRIFEIELRGGKRVKGTEDHSFFKLRSDGSLEEVTPAGLSVGDYLVSGLGFPFGCNTELSIEDAEFLGLWFGDGFIGLSSEQRPSHIHVSKQHQPAIRSVCERTASRWSCSWHLKPHSVDGFFCNSIFARWIVRNFGRIGEDKFISPLVLSAPLEVQAAFLRGYFSADGSAKGSNGVISLSCFRRDIIETVQLLLDNLDIRSSITVNRPGSGTKSPFDQWKVNVSDGESIDRFMRLVGFFQEDQLKASAENKVSFYCSGAHRGLPVSLLRSEWLYRPFSKGMFRTQRFSPRRRTSPIKENFVKQLREMECEYLEVKSVKQVSSEDLYVYDLEIPTTQRFFANGILAHNTTQVDFRDAPWYTVDSITWKTGEIYGTLIDWDEHLQKLIFCTNKAERHLFREKLKRHGFDAEAIVGDTNYKELTRYGLFSYRRMEKFYVERYRNRVMFYELRLPHRNVLHQLSPKALLRKWERFRPEEKFKEHAHSTTQQILEYLCVLSSVQNGDSVWLQNTASAKDFLEPYFPKLVDPFPSDPRILQKELAVYTAPPNPPPKAREDSEHYRPMNNPPRAREEVLYCPEDLQLLSFYPEPEKL